MFNNIRNIQDARKRMLVAEGEAEFSSALNDLRRFLKQLEMNSEILVELERRAYYIQNEYSEKDTREKMQEAKNRVIEYIDELMCNSTENNMLLRVLDNFYLFLESLLEREPHKKGGIQKEQLECIKIKNEYDVQHLLFAYLKPLYPTARAEVSEDTGYHTVRVDIALDTNCVIEVKCTRKGMALNKLVEEVEADMVHYSAKSIYFFIYDKEKIIENPLAFKKSNEEKMSDKRIHIIIHQPKIL